MKWKDIAGTVGKFAPLLGTALGGPAGGAIGGLVAGALGAESSPEAVAAAIAGDPDAAIKLRQLEKDNEKDIRAHAFKILDAELNDKQDARKNHKDDKTPSVLVYMLTLLVAGGAALLFLVNIPEGNRAIAYMLFGGIVAKWGDSIAYWVGTTRSSSVKNNWAKIEK